MLNATTQSFDLNGEWRLTYGPDDGSGPSSPDDLLNTDWPTIPATVPGNVELDLIAAGRLEDPSTGNRIYALRELETNEWWYRRSFKGPVLHPGDHAELVFDGLDCLATVWLNGEIIGTPDNMLIPHRLDIATVLRQGEENELVVRILSAVLAGRRHERSVCEHPLPGGWEALAIRKAPHMYGWDIMPRVVSAGLWRDVRVEITPGNLWRSVYWATLDVDVVERTATIMVDWSFETDRSCVDDLTIRVMIDRPGFVLHASEHPVVSPHGKESFEVDNVDLWWPRGYGEPALYTAMLELVDSEGVVLAASVCRIGLRTLQLARTDTTSEEDPGEFVFVVNGERVFVHGTNWVPLDAFHSRDREHLDATVDMLTDLNCNMVRCWGGNIYEDHAFFDRCDENGIMVWQDFALACATYPQTDDFAQTIGNEAQVIVTRLRNHPSLALWAGNNEGDQVFQWNGLDHLDPNDDRLSREALPAVVCQFDPLRAYLPSSPYRSPEVFRRQDDSLMPEVHLWGPRGYYKHPFYMSSPAHFVSEIGYHGCPSRETLEQMFDSKYVWPWQDNDQWLTKAVRPHRNITKYDYRINLMAQQIGYLFEEIPEDLDDFVLASQITQAEAKKFFIEWWRQGKWRRTGILWWNLRDGWPIVSDAVVDYYGRKKLAYQFIKRVQTDVCAIIGEPEDGPHPLIVVNDTLLDVRGFVSVRNADTGQVMVAMDFEVQANGRVVVDRIPQVTVPEMWLIEWWTEGGNPCHSHYLAGSPPVRLDDYRRWLGRLG